MIDYYFIDKWDSFFQVIRFTITKTKQKNQLNWWWWCHWWLNYKWKYIKHIIQRISISPKKLFTKNNYPIWPIFVNRFFLSLYIIISKKKKIKKNWFYVINVSTIQWQSSIFFHFFSSLAVSLHQIQNIFIQPTSHHYYHHYWLNRNKIIIMI